MIVDKSNAAINSELIVTLAKQALDNLPNWKSQQANYSASDFREEFGTVTIALPRRSGHSVAALQLLYEYPDALVFVPDGSSRNCMKSELRKFTEDHDVYNRIDNSILIPTPPSLIPIKPVGNRSFIIFDQFLRMKKEQVVMATTALDANIIVKLQ